MVCFTCVRCGSKVCSTGATAVCPMCGQQYKLEGDPPEWGWLAGGFILGLIAGFFIFTSLGRELAIAAIQKGAEVTRERVEEWLRKGEAE